MFDRVDALENCIVYLAAHWCPGGVVPCDSRLRAKFVERIVSSYIEPLQPTADWNEELREMFRKEKERIAEQMAMAAAKLADQQDTELVN